eukprot:scaffold41979_cov64-Phaeocystis_antarctica.AAC.1
MRRVGWSARSRAGWRRSSSSLFSPFFSEPKRRPTRCPDAMAWRGSGFVLGFGFGLGLRFGLRLGLGLGSGLGLKPHEMASAAISAAARGVSTGTLASRGLAVVASTSWRSSVAAGMSTKVCASSSSGAAPQARACASSVSQGCVSGATSRRSDRPKLSMARATAPMFPGAKGLASRMTGCVALVARAASIAAILVGGGASRLVFITTLP